ncbi:hypothetical protein PIB30_058056 [Stylosanthes scabra]|uniref:Uncharacterized protein n=1 Tax=Stylosanthes scabra TaxID=79078 RepID=A0ABU6YMB4_9FABA|nr:hypothetical protein [Stylosanthes scabra]
MARTATPNSAISSPASYAFPYQEFEEVSIPPHLMVGSSEDLLFHRRCTGSFGHRSPDQARGLMKSCRGRALKAARREIQQRLRSRAVQNVPPRQRMLGAEVRADRAIASGCNLMKAKMEIPRFRAMTQPFLKPNST